VLRGGIEHTAQQLAVLSLQLLPLPKGQPGARDPIGQRVAHALQLSQVGDSRLAARDGDAGIDLKSRERLDHEA
jgi:hypothetical protein